jgi:hypothetical protein
MAVSWHDGAMPKGDIIFWFWHVALPRTVIASFLELWMRWRLEQHGYQRRWWDVALYGRVAPAKGWSRFPLVVSLGIVLFGFAALLCSK